MAYQGRVTAPVTLVAIDDWFRIGRCTGSTPVQIEILNNGPDRPGRASRIHMGEIALTRLSVLVILDNDFIPNWAYGVFDAWRATGRRVSEDSRGTSWPARSYLDSGDPRDATLRKPA
jgi:hypothetical protein